MDLIFDLVALFFISFFHFFYYFKKLFLIIIFYFNNFYFILFYLIFFLSFFLFLPLILSHVDDRLLGLQPGLRAVPLRWASQVQDTGPKDTSQLHVISNGENPQEISISTPRPSSTQRPASSSAKYPMPKNKQE